MKKSDLQKPIKTVLHDYGFVHTKGDDFAFLAGDQKTKLVLRIPDGRKGFILGAQFSDLYAFDGILAHSAMLQYDHAYDLAYGSVKEYTVDEIKTVTERVISDYEPYRINGASEIGMRLNEWTFGDLDERIRDMLLRHFGQAGINPYSKEYLLKNVEELSAKGGMIVLSEEEYASHKSFYDRYAEHGAEIVMKNSAREVHIIFQPASKWYQQ